MGCWNGTCGVSQLPITAGQKVKAILLLQSEYHQEMQGSGSCYISNFFRPWFFPVTAHYNDYGSIEHIEDDWNSRYMLETFQRWLKEGEVKILGEDAEINSPDIDRFTKLDDVFDCVERGALVKKNYGKHFDKEQNKWVLDGGYLKIGLFMVLDNVYTDMVKAAQRFINKPENDYIKKYYVEDRDKALAAIKKARESKITFPIPSLDDVENMGETEKVTTAHAIFRDLYVDRLLGDLIEEHCVYKHYKTVLYVPDVVTVDDFMSVLDDVHFLETAMSYLRKLWIPQTGQGSQSEELEFNEALILAMSEHIGDRKKQFEKWRLEDEKWHKEYEAKEAAKKAAKKAKQPKKKK